MMRRVVLALCALALAGVQTHAQFLPGRPPGLRPGFQFLGLSNANGFPSPGSVADYDWANGRFAGPPVTVSRASGASVAGPDGLVAQAEPNTARVEYEPKAGAPRKNWIGNSAAYGLVAGTLGSGGGLPTGWSYSNNVGVSAVVAAATVGGVDGFTIRVSGTPTSSSAFQLFPSPSTASQAPAQVNQSWTHAHTLALTAGTTANVFVTLSVEEWGNANNYLSGGFTSFTSSLTATPTRFAHPRTLSSAAAAFAKPVINFQVTQGQAVDLTLFVAQGQHEQSPVPTAWIKTQTQPAEAGGRTNYVRNSTMQGAGVNAMPTGWTGISTSNGLTRTVVGAGKEDGIDYVEIRFAGTTTAAFNGANVITFGGSAELPPASPGQAWTASASLTLTAGSLTGITPTLAVVEYDVAGGNIVTSTTIGLQLNSGPLRGSRYSASRTFSASNVALAGARLQLSIASGVAVDFTIRIGQPQLEQGSGPTPFIPTYGFVVSADSPRTNFVRNSAAIGAVPGMMGSGGVSPLYWNVGGAALGISGQILGVDAGGEYIDVRWFGTTTGTDWATSNAPVSFEGTTTIPASAGQTWTISAGIDVVGGALPSGLVVQLDGSERSSAGGLLGGRAVAITPGAGRSSVTATLGNSGTAYIQPMIRMGFTSPAAGRVVDFTLRIRKPQIEQRGAASEPILTQGIALTTDVERRNLVRTSAQTGLTIGSTAVPATWAGGGNPSGGITRTVVGQGTLPDGTPYTDYRWAGTSTATGANLIANILFDQSGLPASPGQITVTNSVSMALIAGALPVASGNAPPSVVIERTATTNAWTTQPVTLTSALTRFSVTATPTDAGLTMVRPSFWVYGPATSGTPVDFTLRIAVPQFEVSPYATPPIVTTGTAVTVGPGSAYSRGLLIEGSQTNNVANNAMVGASVASNTIPTGWNGSFAGFNLSQQVVATLQQRGLDCIDTRVFGTTNAAAVAILYFGPPADQIAAAPGQLHTLSAYTALVGGSFANLNGLDLTIRENGAGTAFLRQTLGSVMNPSTFSRTVLNVTTGANTTGVTTGIRLTANAGVAIDFTLRTCSPQLERWDPSVSTVGGASSPIRTVGTAAARAADVVSTTLSGFGVPLTVAGVVRSSPFPLANAGVIARVGTGTATGFRAFLNPNSGSLVGGETGFSGVDLGAQPPAGSRFAFAFAGDQSGQAGSLNGGNVVSIGTGLTLGHTLLGIGGNGDGSAPIWGNVERLVLWPYRTPANDNLRSYGSVSNWGN
ncbi:hypothetical protein [Methylobacterium tarhaniae]|uniref:hypothetical protein n=1 Tax=Methylobacterium tarhaniae TaxID=1187852 RepID=UPI003D072212